MGPSLNAPLSPNEELTLRRVALGVAPKEILPARHLARLRKLDLIEGDGALLRLTPLGRHRYRALPRAVDIDEVSPPDNWQRYCCRISAGPRGSLTVVADCALQALARGSRLFRLWERLSGHALDGLEKRLCRGRIVAILAQTSRPASYSSAMMAGMRGSSSPSLIMRRISSFAVTVTITHTQIGSGEFGTPACV